VYKFFDKDDLHLLWKTDVWRYCYTGTSEGMMIFTLGKGTLDLWKSPVFPSKVTTFWVFKSPCQRSTHQDLRLVLNEDTHQGLRPVSTFVKWQKCVKFYTNFKCCKMNKTISQIEIEIIKVDGGWGSFFLHMTVIQTQSFWVIDVLTTTPSNFVEGIKSCFVKCLSFNKGREFTFKLKLKLLENFDSIAIIKLWGKNFEPWNKI